MNQETETNNPTETKTYPSTSVHLVVSSRAGISNTTYHKRCTSEGQKYWWLRKSDGEFVKLPGKYRGDDGFEAHLELTPGKYVLGTGPYGNHGVRQEMTISGIFEKSKITI
jgi:hypothetical protein